MQCQKQIFSCLTLRTVGRCDRENGCGLLPLDSPVILIKIMKRSYSRCPLSFYP